MLRRSRGTPTERRDDRAAIRGVRTPATATRFSARSLPHSLTLIRKSGQRSCARTAPKRFAKAPEHDAWRGDHCDSAVPVWPITNSLGRGLRCVVTSAGGPGLARRSESRTQPALSGEGACVGTKAFGARRPRSRKTYAGDQSGVGLGTRRLQRR